MLQPEKNAYRVNRSLVNVNKTLYPVTHTFVVKEVEKSDEEKWLDDFDGEIVECFNRMSYGTERAVEPPMGVRLEGGISVSMTFACINLEYVDEGFDDYHYYVGDQFGMAYQPCNDRGEPREPYTVSGWIIGCAPSYFSGSVYSPNKAITSFSSSSPGTPFGVLDGIGGFLSTDRRSKPLIFWLYACNIVDTTESENNYTFDPKTSTFQHSDELFNPWERGCRIISNKWKYAPWERYPEYM
jgi:hypothetical protein